MVGFIKIAVSLFADAIRWAAFLKNHAKGILACDFFVAVTATFRMRYVFVVIEHGTRRLVHVNLTKTISANCLSPNATFFRPSRD